MKRRFTITLIFLLICNFNAFASGVVKFEEGFWYTDGNGKWTYFVKDINGTMDYLRNVKVGINEENNFVYTLYYFDMYGHCHKARDDEFLDIYINCYVGSVYDYRKEHDRDGIVVHQSNIALPNIQ